VRQRHGLRPSTWLWVGFHLYSLNYFNVSSGEGHFLKKFGSVTPILVPLDHFSLPRLLKNASNGQN
jgi:hypothetical protein